MADYGSPDPTNLKYLVGHLLLRLNEGITNSGTDRASLDLEATWLEAYTSCVADQDTEYSKEWNAVQALRAKPTAPERGTDDSFDLRMRLLEMRACLRALNRNGVISRMPTNAAPYVPKGARNGVEP